LKLDERLKKLLKTIVDDNKLVSKNGNTGVEQICKGFNKNIRSALSELLPCFENGIYNYIRESGIMPVIHKGGKDGKATLNEMFATAQFRKIIDDLLGKDLAQNIDYLACKKLGANIRNTYARGRIGKSGEFTVDEITLFFLLIRAYCIAYKNDKYRDKIKKRLLGSFTDKPAISLIQI
jgi:hypothetical protein